MEITDVCNLACSFCAGTARERRFLSREEFRELAEKIRPHTAYLYFHLMGEPLLHPLLGDFLQTAHALGFKVILTTNGTRLNETAETLLAAPALFKVSISLHALEANTGLDERRYLAGCFDFADRASKRGIITVFRLWNDGGRNTRNGALLAALRSRFPDGEWAANTKGTRIRQKLFIENGEAFDWPSHAPHERERVTCYALKDHVGVLCDGTVVPCCLDYDGKLALGNLFDTSLDEILCSEHARAFRASLDKAFAPSELCRRCGFAQNKFRLSPSVRMFTTEELT